MSTKTKESAGEILEELQEIEEELSAMDEQDAANRQVLAETTGVRLLDDPQPGRAATGPRYGQEERDPLEGAGPAVVGARGDDEKIQEVKKQRMHADDELKMNHRRRPWLKSRREKLQKEKRKKEAPAELAELQEKTDDVIGSLEGATAAYEAAQREAVGHLRRVGNLRELIGDDAPFMTAAQLHRLGMLLRKRIVERTIWRLGGADGRTIKRPTLFYSHEEALGFMDLLGTPDPSLWERLKDRWITSRDKKSNREEAREKKLRTALRVERPKALAEGRVQDVEDGIEVAKATLASERPSGSRRIHESNESWLTSRRRS